MAYASVLFIEHGYPLFISQLKFSYDKYSVDKVWTKVYCHSYFREITLSLLRSISLALFPSLSIFGWSDLLHFLRKPAAFSLSILSIIVLTLQKFGHTGRMGSHLEKWYTMWKMVHTMKYGTHLEDWATL